VICVPLDYYHVRCCHPPNVTFAPDGNPVPVIVTKAVLRPWHRSTLWGRALSGLRRTSPT